MLYGHRGAAFEAPESTIPGFRHAIAIGLQAVEFDVQLTADGHVVVIHDDTVDRTTSGTGSVASHTLAALQALDARAQFPEWPEPCRVPALADVFDVVGGMQALLVEIKRDTAERLEQVVPAVCAMVRERDLGGRVMLSSFSPYALEVARDVAPEIPRVINGAWREPGTRERAVAAGCLGTDFDVRYVGREHIDWARSNGMRVIGWPCNSAGDLSRLRDAGVDDVGSDLPSIILPLLSGADRQDRSGQE